MNKMDSRDLRADGTPQPAVTKPTRPTWAPPLPPARGAQGEAPGIFAAGSNQHLVPTFRAVAPTPNPADDFVSIATLPGFNAQRGDAERLQGHGVSVQVRDGMLVVSRREVTRAADVLAAVGY
ncbi:MAG: hypothetical protein ABI887_06785 [Burkholderiales bacterium]